MRVTIRCVITAAVLAFAVPAGAQERVDGATLFVDIAALMHLTYRRN